MLRFWGKVSCRKSSKIVRDGFQMSSDNLQYKRKIIGTYMQYKSTNILLLKKQMGQTWFYSVKWLFFQAGVVQGKIAATP